MTDLEICWDIAADIRRLRRNDAAAPHSERVAEIIGALMASVMTLAEIVGRLQLEKERAEKKRAKGIEPS